jgi:hypothetical protein
MARRRVKGPQKNMKNLILGETAVEYFEYLED